MRLNSKSAAPRSSASLPATSVAKTLEVEKKHKEIAMNAAAAVRLPGTAAVSRLHQGRTALGGVGLIPHTALFTGGLLGDAGNRAALVNGSFFQGGPTNSTPLYGEMGGSINLFGPNYLGSGIFAARKP